MSFAGMARFRHSKLSPTRINNPVYYALFYSGIRITAVSATLDCFRRLKDSLNANVVGQTALVDKLTIGLLANGHLLLEGAPGLAKTRALKTLAALIDTSFRRIQFTPDLLPSDITGTEIFKPNSSDFEFKRGPIFNQIVLADEINRAPAKVQSALLEAMAESQVSVGNSTYPLPEPFIVVATQNPIEQAGTYDLPEAQLDRFLLHITVEYPGVAAENAILELARREIYSTRSTAPNAVMHPEQLADGRRKIMSTHMSDAVQQYLIQLVSASRRPGSYNSSLGKSLQDELSYGNDRDYVTPDDVQAVAHDCLRHRLVLSLSAQSRRRTADDVIDDLLTLVPTG